MAQSREVRTSRNMEWADFNGIEGKGKGSSATMVEQSKLCYDPTMRMFIKQFLVENANGGFNVKLLTANEYV